MKKVLVFLFAMTALQLLGCGATEQGTLEITENGTYDVSGYAEVVVQVESEEQPEIVQEEQQINESEQKDSLDLVRVQLRDFSMELPNVMVEDYTEQELLENDTLTFFGEYAEGLTKNATLSIYMSQDYVPNDFSTYFGTDVPTEDINGITMAIRHEHSGDLRVVEVKFEYGENEYDLNLTYPVAEDELYSEYAESFYRSIQMN